MVLGSTRRRVGKWSRLGRDARRVSLSEQVIAVGIWSSVPLGTSGGGNRTLALLRFLLDDYWLGGVCPEHCRMFSTMLASTHQMPVATIQPKCLDIAKCLIKGKIVPG